MSALDNKSSRLFLLEVSITRVKENLKWAYNYGTSKDIDRFKEMLEELENYKEAI